MARVLALVVLSFVCFSETVRGQTTDCNTLLSDLVEKNLRPGWSDYAKLLFLANLTQSDLQSSKVALERSGKLSVGTITVSPNAWNKERQEQLKAELRAMVNLEQLKQYAASAISSSADPGVANAVKDCLAGQIGLSLSFYDLGKDVAVAELKWVSPSGPERSAIIDSVTVVHGKIIGGATYAKEGAELQDRLVQRLTIARDDPKQDVFVIVNTKNAGSAQAYLPPSELPVPSPRLVRAIIESRPITVGSGGQFDGGRNPGCQAHQAQACVQPQHGGKIVNGSGKPRIINQSGRAGVRENEAREGPQEYCATFWASTGACEVPVSVTGVATAVEEYAVDE